MIDIGAIEESISELEDGELTYEKCRNLAALYSVRDHYYKDQRVSKSNKSEFLAVVAGLPVTDVLEIMDEVMQAVRIMNSKTYDATIRQLKKLGDSP